MRNSVYLVVATILLCSVNAFVPRAPESTAAAALSKRQTVANPCAAVSRTIAASAEETPLFEPSLAIQCLESIPLNINRSVGYIEYIRPYLQFQSTIAYLKDPPKGYTLPGADIFGGLDTIKANVQNNVYKSQWSFEKDLWTLVNILPHDFHLNLPLPLVSVFKFGTYRNLISVSDDGSAVPSVYFKRDWDNWSSGDELPSPIAKINGVAATSFIEALSLKSSQFQDPDAMYNKMFYSIPSALQEGGNAFYTGAWQLGFDSDTTIYTYGNGSTVTLDNAASALIDFTGITTGEILFQEVEVSPTDDVTTSSKRDLLTDPMMEIQQFQKRQSSGSDEMPGYPTPDVVHPEGPYTAGFILTGDVAVLTMSAFTSSNESSTTDQANMQITIAKLLAKAKTSGSKYLIIDLSANGGGSVYSGYDAFKQLFPTIVPYGGSRMRTNPYVDYMGDVFSTAGIYNRTIFPPWQIQSALDKDLTKYPDWASMGGPNRIYGDNMLGITRANLSDPLMTADFSVYGYQDNPTIPAQVFDPANTVILYDGGCGSTCAIFAEFMKTQGGVRSVAVGGRAQTGPMQGVGGSKGAQVLTYYTIEVHRDALKHSLSALTIAKKTPPTLPDPSFIPPDLLSDTPLGSKTRFLKGSRINLRSAIRADDTSQTPLQFTYEPVNCRLYYTIDDVYDVSNLWGRVYNVTWGGASCVSGSSVNGDKMPGKATDTVAYDSKVNTQVKVPDQPGLVPIGSNPGTGANVGIAEFKPVAGSSSSSGGAKKSVGVGMRVGKAVLVLVLLFVGALLWL